MDTQQLDKPKRSVEKRVTYDEKFSVGLEKLKSFAEREGSTTVPVGHVEDGYRLYTWVTTQRMNRPILKPDRVMALESIPGWTWSKEKAVRRPSPRLVAPGLEPIAIRRAKKEDVKRQAFKNALNRLGQFADEYGHAIVPENYRVKGFPLGQWVLVQRRKKKRSLLSEEYVEYLDAIPGWTWERVKREVRVRLPPLPVLDPFPIENIGLSIRTSNCLINAGILSVSDLVGKTDEELLAIEKFGVACLKEVRAMLAELETSMTKAGERVTQSVPTARVELDAINLPDDVDVRAIRKAQGLSQHQFAKRYGFSTASIQAWEQGRRRPEQAVRVLLMVIAHDPEMVRSVLASSASKVTL